MERPQADIDDLIARRDALDRQIEEASKNARTNDLNLCRELIKKHGFTVQDLGMKRSLRKQNSVAPKYVGPGGITWAGRGRKPIWLQEAEKHGKTADDFRILTPELQSEQDETEE